MYNQDDLCRKIIDLYPDIGECGIDIWVDFDESKQAWTVELKKEQHKLKHYLDLPEAEQCMKDEQCVSLGLEIAQLRKHIEGKQF